MCWIAKTARLEAGIIINGTYGGQPSIWRISSESSLAIESIEMDLDSNAVVAYASPTGVMAGSILDRTFRGEYTGENMTCEHEICKR